MNDTQFLKDLEIQGDRHIHNDKGTYSMTNVWEKSCKHRDKAGINQVNRKLTWRHRSHFRWLQRLGRSFHVGWSMCLLHSGQDGKGRGQAGSRHCLGKGIRHHSLGEGSARPRPVGGHRQQVCADSTGVDSDRCGAGNTIWG